MFSGVSAEGTPRWATIANEGIQVFLDDVFRLCKPLGTPAGQAVGKPGAYVCGVVVDLARERRRNAFNEPLLADIKAVVPDDAAGEFLPVALPGFKGVNGFDVQSGLLYVRNAQPAPGKAKDGFGPRQVYQDVSDIKKERANAHSVA